MPDSLLNEPILPDYKSDFLFLLVGKNPLPNLIVAQLLANDKATVCLLYSDGQDGEPSTQEAADKLHDALDEKRDDIVVIKEAIPSSKKWDIVTRLEQIINDTKPTGQIGLNYTGATKPMSIHTYRTIEQCFKDFNPTFSYLDPRKVALRIDGRRETVSYSILQNSHLRPLVELTLEQLTALHGYEPDPNHKKGPPEWPLAAETPGLFELCEAIATVHVNATKLKQWRAWLDTGCIELPEVTDYPGLTPVLEAMDSLCHSKATADNVIAILKPDAKKGLKSCSKWFLSSWLEEYTAVCFQKAASESQLTLPHQNLHYRLADQTTGSDSFELDLAGILGYQLFAVSCLNSDGQSESKKERIKEHFLEIFVRARQLGGDETRFALVCLYNDPERIEREISRSWDAQGQIKVFGANHVGRLTDHLRQWFTTENR